MRLSAPGLVTALLLNLVATRNNYFLPLVMLNNPRLFPITVGLAQWNAQATAGAGSQALFNLVITGSVISSFSADRRIPVPSAVLAEWPDARRRQGVAEF